MAKLSRLATTITSHEVEGDHLINTFYLDGRSNRFPQNSDLDITLDRSDSGFYLNISSSSRDEATRDSIIEKRQSQDAILDQIKDYNNGDIDTSINDMAENAISLTGKFNIDNQKNDRRPYYAGFLVKEGELASITLGSAVAFLYRDNILYPLTENDLSFAEIDDEGNEVNDYNIYAAGRAGSIRYSNIAQIRIDDCIILSTTNILEIFGQEKFLRLLDEVYDQQETAELIHEYILAKHPDEPYQFMMTFVEDVYTVKRKYKGEGLAERDTQSTQIFSAEALAAYEADKKLKEDRLNEDNNAGSQESNNIGEEDKLIDNDNTKAHQINQVDITKDNNIYAHSDLNDSSNYDSSEKFIDKNVDDEQITTSIENSSKTSNDSDDLDDDSEHYAYQNSNDAAYDYDEDGYDDEDVRYGVGSLNKDNDKLDNLDDNFIDKNAHDEDKNRNIFFVVILLIVVALALLGLSFLFKNRKNNENNDTNKSSNQVSISNNVEDSSEPSESNKPTESSAEETSTTTTEEIVNGTRKAKNGGTYPDKYTIQWGDSFYSIAKNVYGESFNLNVDQVTLNKVFDLIVKHNPEKIPGNIEDGSAKLFAEVQISIPDPSNVLEVLEKE